MIYIYIHSQSLIMFDRPLVMHPRLMVHVPNSTQIDLLLGCFLGQLVYSWYTVYIQQ
jgi:hypothetical protein